MDDVIVTEHLTKVYPGDIRAVDDLSLSVQRGQIFGLLGPNGAGKSTTAGMLTTRVIPTSGRAIVGGVVTDTGGVLSHSGICAREYGIPCVVGTQNGTALIEDGMQVRVDGSTGIVTILGKQRRG